MTTPSARAEQQYADTTGNLTARMAVHEFGTNPQDWYSWLAERLPLSGRVLEVGAGTGRLWSTVPHEQVDLTLTDVSAVMCARLAGVAGAVVRRCEAGALPFADGGFDTVVANHMLYHVDDPAAVLREFARVLRPGGRLAVATNGRRHMAELKDLGTGMGTHSEVTEVTGPALVGAVFDDVRVQDYPDVLEIPSVEPVVAYLGSMCEVPLTEERVAVVRRVVGERIAAEGVFRVRKHVLLITATRRLP
ncbi:hypothetical protein GCM10010172_06030 [Paractinoplanes ferrugineus]|uniref:Methyltransferase type 11 domain-containing protein n=1 Tax=Paractinoplanes ferrugineus TaxID=113564 RepID=A0A919MHB8_9ACTN|nr:class I SAM-dependent methyltransferase [Actinoplanes ferrugineus]GIE12480.1 hypothetical protein Afe05nite_43200 [Actinoplanes ferrugineus]